MKKHVVAVTQMTTGLRLDSFIASEIPVISRRRARTLITNGAVYINRKRVRIQSRQVNLYDQIVVYDDAKTIKSICTAEELPILYEDAIIAVVNKPVGLASDATRWSRINSVPYLLEQRYGRGGRYTPIHRLDMDASGLLLVSKVPAYTKLLTAAFKAPSTSKHYLAVVTGLVQPLSGSFEFKIAPDPTRQGRYLAATTEGKSAQTRYQVIRYCSERNASLMKIDLLTGRTHQIRVHFSAAGYPVVGDRLYREAAGANRLMLHAYALSFMHPLTNKKLSVIAPPPAEFNYSGDEAEDRAPLDNRAE